MSPLTGLKIYKNLINYKHFVPIGTVQTASYSEIDSVGVFFGEFRVIGGLIVHQLHEIHQLNKTRNKDTDLFNSRLKLLQVVLE